MNAMSREKLLSLLLRDVKKDYDYILLDCSPSLGMITINALTASVKWMLLFIKDGEKVIR